MTICSTSQHSFIAMQRREFKLIPSRIYCTIVLACLGFSAFMPCFLALNWPIKLAICATVLLYGLQIFAAIFSQDSVHACTHLKDRLWLLHSQNGLYQAELLGSSIVTKWLSVLHFKAENNVKYCVILPDSMIFSDYRSLYVTLKIN